MEKLKKIVEIVVPAFCAVAVVMGFLALIFILIFYGKEIPKSVETQLNILTGALCAAFVGLIGYWFGSSSGSKAKTEMMEKAATETK